MYNAKDAELMNTKMIERELKELGDDLTWEIVSEILPQRIAEKKLRLDHSVYTPKDPEAVNGFGRYLVYDHPDKKNPFSLWVFAFAEKQKTAIHDHAYKGSVIVLEGPVSEKFYQPVGENSAQLVDRIDRYSFHHNKDDLNNDFVHQLKRRKGLGEGVSLTLHIYKMEAQLINEENEIIDRRNLDKIYSKNRMFDKSGLPPYKKVFSEDRGETCALGQAC